MARIETRTQAATIFLKAAAYIRQCGWREKGMNVHGQPRCSMGALASAHPNRKWDKKLASLMYQSLYKELNGLSLTQFNYKFKNGNKVANLYEQVARSLIRQF